MALDNQALLAALRAFQPADAAEAADVERLEQLVREADPWPRSSPLHVTGSALIVDPVSRRVLLRWHARQHAWLQVGGHGDPGERDPYQVALREGREETGLTDLRPWPGPEPRVIQVAIVAVPAGKGEPPHEHADVRYALATDRPETAVAESAEARVEWLGLTAALQRTTDDNVRIGLRRVQAFFDR